MYRVFIKRLVDILSSLIMIIIFSPLILIIFLFLFISNNGKVFFVQDRPGKGEKIIRVFKFKTMNENKDKEGHLLPDADRLTAVGKFIRTTSLDELPQLFNVLKGDMSLIGPRPLLVKYLPLYNDFQKRRHEVRPGITGWAQINGRNAISWQKKFELDVWYVDNLCFLLDLKIIGLTIKKVFLREGISGKGIPTAQAFKGNL